MSKVAMIENSMVSQTTFPNHLSESQTELDEVLILAVFVPKQERCLLDIPYDLLFEILRRLPKRKLVEISKLCSIFRDVAGDKCFWKNVYIKHGQGVVAFKELYSEPWPVKVIDLKGTEIKPPVSSKIDRVVKVRKLDLSSIRANKVTMEAILAKYQCTELHLNSNSVQYSEIVNYYSIDYQNHTIMGIAPEAFSKQAGLEVLKLVNISRLRLEKDESSGKLYVNPIPCKLWLAPVLDNCKNLRELDLDSNHMWNYDMLGFVRNLPKSLEKLSLLYNMPKNSFFTKLAKRCPNLRELKLHTTEITKFPSILKFQFLEVLYVYPDSNSSHQDNSDLYMYLIKLPALKTVYVGHSILGHPEINVENLQTTLQPHGIIVKLAESPEGSSFPEDGTLWEVSKAN